ncbi:MAG: DUF2007 domain-containing protein [Terriglobales bacterium]
MQQGRETSERGIIGAMATMDPEEERRLADFYSCQLDGELLKLAGQASELTDVAREVLRSEIERRGLKEEDGRAPAEPEAAEQDNVHSASLVTIKRFRDLPEALLAKGSLESAGIATLLVDENMIRLDWFISNLLGGIKLQVAPEDVEEATAILSEPIPESLDLEGTEKYEQPRCPNCQSLDVNFEELNKLLAYGSAWAGVPIPLHRKGWRCQSCGHQWQEKGDDKAGP